VYTVSLVRQVLGVSPSRRLDGANSDGPFSLTASYKAAARALAEKQLALAGARLGNVLNGELK
jgi:hypothetical protein